MTQPVLCPALSAQVSTGHHGTLTFSFFTSFSQAVVPVAAMKVVVLVPDSSSLLQCL